MALERKIGFFGEKSMRCSLEWNTHERRSLHWGSTFLNKDVSLMSKRCTDNCHRVAM